MDTIYDDEMWHKNERRIPVFPAVILSNYASRQRVEPSVAAKVTHFNARNNGLRSYTNPYLRARLKVLITYHKLIPVTLIQIYR